MIADIVLKGDMWLSSEIAETKSLDYKVLEFAVARIDGQMLCLLKLVCDIRLTVSVSNWSSSSINPTNSNSVPFTTLKSGVSKLLIFIIQLDETCLSFAPWGHSRA